jgi:16S rRNA (adenine1518-N6/adenine1519-N6)-dimethyltransferase
MTLGRREVIELLARHGVSPGRALGQNFVVDPNTVRRIARLAGCGPGDRVVEVGAGVGCLTLALVETGAEVTALEIDRHLAPVLEETLAGLPVRVVIGDAMTVDWGEVLAAAPGAAPGEHSAGPWRLVANLPYNVGTPLLARLLDEVPAIERFLVMVQREVGERLVADPGGRAYGALSVKVASWATARIVGSVPASVFLPRPRVDSVLVELVRHAEPRLPADVDRAGWEELVRQGFAQRRKMLRSALRTTADAAAFAAAGVDPSARAETLDVEQWVALWRATR